MNQNARQRPLGDHLRAAQNRYSRRLPPTPVVSAVLSDGSIVETVYWLKERKTAFCVWKEIKWRLEREIVTRTRRLVPYSPTNNLIANDVVLLPSEPGEFRDVGDLVEDVQRYIHRYVDLTPAFEKLAAYYVLLTWVYDAFSDLPYLRLLGDPGSGKTRFLLTVGALCYKPIFASGASTVSPLFRILDTVRGTLIIDEGDFAFSDEKAEIVKILNNGNAEGFPVLRSEVSRTKEFNPVAYRVYGPKILATRGRFDDPALESRCLTEETGTRSLREDVPIHLPAGYKDEALGLRNRLLTFRFRNLARLKAAERPVAKGIEPRLAQIFGPLLTLVEDAVEREELLSLARGYQDELVAERGMAVEAQVLEVIRDLSASGDGRIAVQDVATWFTERHGEEYDRRVTPRWIGYIIRRRLHLKTAKSNGIYVIPVEERPKLGRLYIRYGLETQRAVLKA